MAPFARPCPQWGPGTPSILGEGVSCADSPVPEPLGTALWSARGSARGNPAFFLGPPGYSCSGQESLANGHVDPQCSSFSQVRQALANIPTNEKFTWRRVQPLLNYSAARQARTVPGKLRARTREAPTYPRKGGPAGQPPAQERPPRFWKKASPGYLRNWGRLFGETIPKGPLVCRRVRLWTWEEEALFPITRPFPGGGSPRRTDLS